MLTFGTIDIKNILLFIVSITTAYFSFFIVRGNKSYSNNVFSMFILFVGLWAIGLSLFDLSEQVYWSLIFEKFYYISAAGIPLFYTLFALSFPNKIIHGRTQGILISLFLILSAFIIYYPNFIIDSLKIINYEKEVKLDTISYIIYTIYFISLILFSYTRMIKTFIKMDKGKEIRLQLKLMIVGTLIPFVFGMFFDLILPIFSYDYIWLGPIFGLMVVIVVVYSIYKHHLFDVKVITSEIFTFALLLFILIRTITTEYPTERNANLVLFSLSLFFGFFLIRSVKKESDNKEKIEKLAINLEKTNIRLKELDQKKSEFMSLATHQLRAPLTAMRGYSSMILDGTFGKVNNPEVEDAIDKISRSTTDLVMIVEDYLNISRIEQGRMQYDFAIVNIAEMVENIIKEVHVSVESVGLHMNIYYDKDKQYKVNVDEGKIKQVLFNIIDNSIKYTPKGGIDIYIEEKPQGKVLIAIKDTGVGIKPEVLPSLFHKFTRAPDASKTNILGTGLGLYVADQILKAHNARAWAESEGEGKGSQFYVELSMVE